MYRDFITEKTIKIKIGFSIFFVLQYKNRRDQKGIDQI